MLGISTMVEVLLIILLLTTLVSLLWVFTSGTINSITISGTNQTQRAQEIFSTCMIVDSVHGNTVYLRNCGYGVITNSSLNVYLDDTPLAFNMTPQTISKGGVGTITTNLFGLSVGIHNLKITNPSAQTVQEVETSLPDSCVLALDFDEGSGTIAHDSSGNGNDGTLVNGPQWVNGKFGKALQFDGINDYVNIIDSTSLNSSNTTSGITVSLWINENCNLPAGSYRFISKGVYYSDDINFGGPGWSASTYLFYLTISGSNQYLRSTADYICGNWNHIVETYDGSTMKLYINGVLNNSLSVSGSITFVQGRNWYIGGTPWYDYVSGTIDSVRIYNQALTPDQIGISLKMK